MAPVKRWVLLTLGAIAVLWSHTSVADPFLTFIEHETHPSSVGGFDVDVAVAPDSKHVYVSTDAGDSLVVLEAVPAGGLSFVEVQQDGVGGVDGLDGPTEVAISPDGAHVYVHGRDDFAIAVFGRDASTGALTFIETVPSGSTPFNEDGEMVLSHDGRHLYLSSVVRPAGVVTYARDLVTGELTSVSQPDIDARILALDMSPDDAFLYGAGRQSDNRYKTMVMSRDAVTGALTEVEVGPEEGDPKIGDFGIVVSPDGRHVYNVFGRFGSLPTFEYGPSVFTRNVVTGTLQRKDENLDFPADRDQDVEVSSDGAQVLTVASTSEPSLFVYQRHPRHGRLAVAEVLRASAVPGLPPGWVGSAMAISPDQRRVYVAGQGVAVFELAACSPPFKSKLIINKINLDPTPGDDVLVFKADFLMRNESFGSLDPLTTGIDVTVATAAGGSVLAVSLPGGAFGGGGTAGWQQKGANWLYVDKTPVPLAGVKKVVLTDRSAKQPGVASIKVLGKKGSYAFVAGDEPPTVRVDLGLTDVCVQAAYPVAGDCAFNGAQTKFRCKK
jgi:6-phosphogluconolactonase (cycloisomerase 2 family)